VIAYVSSLLISFVALVALAPEVVKYLLSPLQATVPRQLLKNQRFSHFINELCSRVSLMSDNIIISLFMGAGPVTAFFITQKVGNMMQQQLQHLSNSSWAALSELHYQGKHEQFNKRVLDLTELIAFSSGVVLSIVCLLNFSFVSLWTGVHTFSGPTVTNLTAINAALFSILSLWSWCFAATNLTQKMVTMSIAQGVVNIIASVLLTSYLGITGPLYGTLIGYVGVSLFWKSTVLCKTFHIDFLQLTLAWFKPLVPPLGAMLIFLSLYGSPSLDSWLKLFVTAAVSTVLLTSVCYFFLLSTENKTVLKKILSSFKRKIFKS
jgi:O-antigen/teichoic acid export membrane protein